MLVKKRRKVAQNNQPLVSMLYTGLRHQAENIYEYIYQRQKNAPEYKLRAASGKIGQFKCYHGIAELCKTSKRVKTSKIESIG